MLNINELCKIKIRTAQPTTWRHPAIYSAAIVTNRQIVWPAVINQTETLCYVRSVVSSTPDLRECGNPRYVRHSFSFIYTMFVLAYGGYFQRWICIMHVASLLDVVISFWWVVDKKESLVAPPLCSDYISMTYTSLNSFLTVNVPIIPLITMQCMTHTFAMKACIMVLRMWP